MRTFLVYAPITLVVLAFYVGIFWGVIPMEAKTRKGYYLLVLGGHGVAGFFIWLWWATLQIMKG